MFRSTLGWGTIFLVTLAGGASAVGCATGAEDDLTADSLSVVPSDAGEDVAPPKGPVLPPPSQPSEEEEEEEEEQGTDAGATDAGAKSDGGADAGSDAGADGGTDGGVPGCAATNTCLTATDLGSLSGDTGSGTLSAQGTGSQWLKVRLTENNNDIIGLSLALKSTLVSPPGTNYDLYLYVAGSISGQECSLVANSSTSTSTTDSASVQFGESGLVANGLVDDRTVTVEVRHVSGACAAGANWTLTLNGNAL